VGIEWRHFLIYGEIFTVEGSHVRINPSTGESHWQPAQRFSGGSPSALDEVAIDEETAFQLEWVVGRIAF
jgi:hypothetical protein